MFQLFLFFTLFFTAQLTFSSSDELVDQIWEAFQNQSVGHANTLAAKLSEKDNINKKFYVIFKDYRGYLGTILTRSTSSMTPFTLPTIQKLISLKASVNATDSRGCTPLILVIKNFDHIFQIFLSSDNDTLEMEDHYTIIKELLQAKADPNIKDKYGKTALMYATDHSVIKLLLEFNADTTIKDHEGRTIFDKHYFENFGFKNQERLMKAKEEAEQERLATTCIMSERKRLNTALFGNMQHLLGTPNYPVEE